VFNATFNNISVLLVEKLEYSEETTNLSQVIDKLYHMMSYRVHIAISGCKANYHTTTTTTAPMLFGVGLYLRKNVMRMTTHVGHRATQLDKDKILHTVIAILDL